MGMTPNRSRARKPTFSFPILEPRVLLECCESLQISLSPAELKKPTKSTTRRVYESFVVLLTGMEREELQVPSYEGYEALSYPELHSDSIPQCNLLRHTTNLLETCGCPNFTLMDLVNPNPKTFR